MASTGGCEAHEALFAVLAQESRAAGALVVGEDLGTGPEGFSALLERWGVLSTRLMLFERRARRQPGG